MLNLNDLMERDREEALRVSIRKLAFPDQTTRAVEAYRVVWRWFDHLVAYEYAVDVKEILKYVLWTMEDRDYAGGEALGLVVEYLVVSTEQRGGDDTNDNFGRMIAKQAIERFRVWK